MHLILGNDLTGGKVAVNAIVTEKPCSEHFLDPVENTIPGLYPACVVTRAMSKKKENSEDKITLTDTVSHQKPQVLSQSKSLLRVVCQKILIRCQSHSLLWNSITTQNFQACFQVLLMKMKSHRILYAFFYKEQSANENVEAT